MNLHQTTAAFSIKVRGQFYGKQITIGQFSRTFIHCFKARFYAVICLQMAKYFHAFSFIVIFAWPLLSFVIDVQHFIYLFHDIIFTCKLVLFKFFYLWQQFLGQLLRHLIPPSSHIFSRNLEEPPSRPYTHPSLWRISV